MKNKQKKLMRSFRLHPDTIKKLLLLSKKKKLSQSRLIESAIDKLDR